MWGPTLTPSVLSEGSPGGCSGTSRWEILSPTSQLWETEKYEMRNDLKKEEELHINANNEDRAGLWLVFPLHDITHH